MSSYGDLWGNTKLRTDKTQYLKYKNYVHARYIMERYRTNCSDETKIQMPNYTYNPDKINLYLFINVSHSEILEYEKTIQEFVNSLNEFLRTL